VLAASCGCAFCVDCLSTYVRSKVEAGEVTAEQLVCPVVEPRRCGVPLTPQDVQRCLPAGQAERYDRLTLQRCVEAQDDLGHCPSAGCPFVFAWESDNRKLVCPLCSKSFCLLCRAEPWHTGMRCEQFQAERGDPEASDAAFAQFASSQRLKQCPKCRWWVEKSSGCDAMHCRCNLVFCYKCGGVLKGGVANKANRELKTCSCSAQDAANLRVHETAGRAGNHNLQPQRGGPNHQPGFAAGMAAAVGQALARGGGPRVGFRGGFMPRLPAGAFAQLMGLAAGGEDEDEEQDEW